MQTAPQEDVFSKRLDLRLWAQVFRHALPYRRLLVPLVLAAVAIAILEASFALVTRWAVDDVVAHGDGISLIPYILVYVSIVIVFATGVFIFIVNAGGLSCHMSHDIRRDSFSPLAGTGVFLLRSPPARLVDFAPYFGLRQTCPHHRLGNARPRVGLLSHLRDRGGIGRFAPGARLARALRSFRRSSPLAHGFRRSFF